jgi:hypothetical protein
MKVRVRIAGSERKSTVREKTRKKYGYRHRGSRIATDESTGF